MKRSGGAGFFFPVLAAVLFWMNAPGIAAQNSAVSGDFPGTGDGPMAERYVLWIKELVDQGRHGEALAALERASDFADVSSDVSYMLALLRSRENRPRGGVIEALNRALAVGRWNLYSAGEARFLLAENLVALRAYSGALAELFHGGVTGPAEAELCLKALGKTRPGEFRRFMTETLDRYPREPGPVRIFFDFLKSETLEGRNPGETDIELLDLIIKRLPVLLPLDAELAWMSAPFTRDVSGARRLVAAYRAVNAPLRESLPAALRLGVIDDETALEELFAPAGGELSRTASGNSALDIALLGELWGLLRRKEARTLFRRNLSAYTGVITEDADRDGIPETFAEYREGIPVKAAYDTLQEGIPLLSVYFEAGVPLRARTLMPPEDGAGNGERLVYTGNRREAELLWERYPALAETEFAGATFFARPMDFNYSPVLFDELWGSGVLFPRRDSLVPPLTRRTIVTRALRVERPSGEFAGGREVVELAQGIPVRAREYLGELEVSETEFLRGRPRLERVDLDLDGRKETARFFGRDYPAAELEDLWNYERNIERTVTASDWTE